MTQLGARLGNAMSKTISRLFGRSQTPTAVIDEPVEPEPDLVLLDRILQVVAVRPGHSDDFRLLTEQMSTDCIMFRSDCPLRIGDELLVQILINRGCMLTIPGRINWVMDTEKGRVGQLDLCATLDQKEELRGFLREACRGL